MTIITTTGKAEAHYVAERATLTLRIEHRATDRNQSITMATAIHNFLLARSEQLHEEGDATWLSSEPLSTYVEKTLAEGSKKTVITEYVTRSVIRVKLSNLGLVADLVDEFSRSGAEVDVDWALTEDSRKRYERRMRKEAVLAAHFRALDYAEALDQKIIETVRISDGSHYGDDYPHLRARFDDGVAKVTIAEITVSAKVSGEYRAA